MNWRLLGIAAGCSGMLMGGAVAASHYLGSTTSQPEDPALLFVQSAEQVAPSVSWPAKRGAVEFNGEMIALLTMGANAMATARPVAAGPDAQAQDTKPQQRGSRQERRRAQQERRTRSRAERAERAERQRFERARAQAERAGARRAWAAASEDEMEVPVRDRNGHILRMHRVEREVEGRSPRSAQAPSPFRMFGPFGDW